MERVAIIGLGLMGGSLGLALKARHPRCVVAGFTRSIERGRTAKRRGAVDELHDEAGDAVDGADVVVCCTPILSIPPLVKDIRSRLKAGCLVTDVGSTKAFLAHEVPLALGDSAAVYVGSHPLCGSEQQGIGAARRDLYRDAVVIVTPAKRSDSAHMDEARKFWKDLGSVVTYMEPLEHDRVICRTSHLPHMVASVLVATVARSGGLDRLSNFCASGFRDSTRIAEGSPEMWGDIVRTNRANVAEELRAFRVQLDELIGMLDRGDLSGVSQYLERGKAAREALTAAKTEKKRRRVA
jgi:prephenate dehydrogenase